MVSKPCTNCKIEKDLSEFAARKSARDGVQSRCKACVALYYQKNRARRLEYAHTYYAEHREERKARRRDTYAESPEKERAYQRDHYATHREERNNKSKAWAKANPDKVRVNHQRRRERAQNAEGSHTRQEWLEVIQKQGGACATCGQVVTLVRDHIIPLSKGGSDYISNIQGLCRSCNSKKHAKLPVT